MKGVWALSGFLQVHTPEWLEYLTRNGYPGVTALATGVEGVIYRLEAELVLMQLAIRGLTPASLR